MRSTILLASMLFAAPAAAATYSATPASPVAGRFIARDIVWNCGAGGCQGSTQESRPLVLCESLAKSAGKVASFVVDGRPFSAAELDRCNAFAKAPPPQVAARQ